MKSISNLMSEMKDAGAPLEAVLIAVAAIDEATSELNAEVQRLRLADEGRRQKRTVQKRNEREVSREVAATVERLSRDNDSDDDATRGATVASEPASPSPPKRYNQTPSSSPTPSVEAQAREWFSESFYPEWPHKVGRAQAEKAAVKLFRSRRGDMAAVIEGRDRYIRDKPADRPWLNPASFLNGERFNDRPAAVARAGPRAPFEDGRTTLSRQLGDMIHGYQSDQHHPGSNGREARAPNTGATSLFDDSDERHRDDAGGQVLRLAGAGPYGRR